MSIRLNKKAVLILTVSLGACFCIFYKSQVCAQGVRDGLKLCAATVIPSLFPFLIVSQFITESGLTDFLGKAFDKSVKTLFGLPGICAPVIFMSLIGGFPVGARMTAELLTQKKICTGEAQRLNMFCINAGPAFIIGTVGSMMLSSVRAGVILYVSTALSSLMLGVLTRFLSFKKSENEEKGRVIFLNNPVAALSSSVSSSVNVMLSICAWIVIFNAIISIILSESDSAGVTVLCSILEVTNGVRLSAELFPLPVLAAIIGFGGISVHCQILPFVLRSELKIRLFLASRAVSAALSAVICKSLLYIFPCEISVFSNYSQISVSAYSVSVPSAVSLIIMCALLIFEVDTNKKMC